jgi:hypothetical protein
VHAQLSRCTKRGLLPPLEVCTWFFYRLRGRTQQLGESTTAIRASVLTDGWNFTTAPPPEAKVIGKHWTYRWAQQPREFVELQG